MRCASCGATARSDQRFCADCGQLLQAPASEPSDGAPNAADEPPERRLVSVLFIDLQGFTRLTEESDPEDIRSLQDDYFALSRTIVERYGGTIEKFIGDAVMAVWGAPRAFEDDAERAVRAALELVASVTRLPRPARRRLKSRAAVTTGEAAVTISGVGQGMLAGDLVNTAARLQHLAPSDGVLVDDTTRRVVGDAIAFEPAGTKRLKGKRIPVTTWRAVEPTRSIQAGRAAGHPGPFVGRDDELHQLIEIYQQVGVAGHSRLVSIGGSAGVGKSRLAWELRRYIEASGGRSVVLSGRAPAYGEGLTFAPLAEMVRHWSAISEGANVQLARARLDGALGAIVDDEDEGRWLAERLAALLSPDPQAAYERKELFAAWRQFFERIASESTAVLVFDDMHRAQPELLEFVESLATWSQASPLMIIVVARPELTTGWPASSTHQDQHWATHLAPLSDQAMVRLLSALMPEVPVDTVEEVLTRAGGIPLYGVEFARLLAAGDTQAGGVPENLHALVAARIDALPDPARRLLITASVLGRRFPRALLEHVAGLDAPALRRPLDALLRHELLTVDDDPPAGPDGHLAFVQDVVREVAYRTLSRGQRRTLHLAAADYLQDTSVADAIEMIAEHLRSALRAAPHEPDAPTLALRAIAALRQAAARANALHARVPALGHLVAALELTEDEHLRAELWSEAAPTATAAGHFDAAERYLRQLLEWQAVRGTAGDVARTKAQLASLMLVTERHATALDDLEEALRAFDHFETQVEGVELAGQVARGHMLLGRDEQAADWARRTLAAAQRLMLPALAVDALTTLGSARVYLGESRQGVADLHQAIEQAAQLRLPSAELRARNNLAWLIVLDDPQAALAEAKSGLKLATRMAMADMAAHLRDVATVTAIDTGDWDFALAVLREAEQNPQAPAHRIALVTSEATLSALRGDLKRAAAAIESLLPIDPAIDPQARSSVDIARAWLAFIAADFDTARAKARAAAETFQGPDLAASLLLAGRAALWQADADAVEQDRINIGQLKNQGRVTDAAQAALAAGAAGIRGGEAAGRLYDDAIARWRELELPLQLALCLIERDRLLGGGAQEADSILRALGAKGLLRLRQLAAGS